MSVHINGKFKSGFSLIWKYETSEHTNVGFIGLRLKPILNHLKPTLNQIKNLTHLLLSHHLPITKPTDTTPSLAFWTRSLKQEEQGTVMYLQRLGRGIWGREELLVTLMRRRRPSELKLAWRDVSIMKLKFSVSLSREEIEEFFSIVFGTKTSENTLFEKKQALGGNHDIVRRGDKPSDLESHFGESPLSFCSLWQRIWNLRIDGAFSF